jgi:hypothetical protein
MEPICNGGSRVMSLLSSDRWADSLETIAWKPGAIAVIDNWHVLHGRDAIDCAVTESRILLRVLVQ